jgi:putative nucleotidyltransferase with HDIG domain
MSKKLPNLAPPFAKTRKQILGYIQKPFKSLSEKQIFWIGFTFLVIITTFLLNNPFWNSNAGELYKEGDVLRESVISPADISQIDEEETKRIRENAAESVRPIFTLEAKRADQAVENFRSAWEGLQRTAVVANANTKNNLANANVKVEPQWLALNNPNEITAVTNALKESSDGLIYNDSDKNFLQNEVSLIDRSKPNQQSMATMPESNWTALSSARGKLKERLTAIKSLSPKEVDSFYVALEPIVQPSVIYDSVATTKEREKITKDIQPLQISLKRGQIVGREGDTITPQILSQINAIRNYSNTNRQWNRFFGLLFLIAALYWVAWKFIEHRGQITRLTLSPEKTFALFGFVVVIQTLIMALAFRLTDYVAAQNVKAPLNDPSLWSFAIPFAFTSLLITLLADRRIALFSGIFTAFLSGLLAPKGLEFTIFAAISSAVAVYGIGQYRSRSSVTTAGALVGVANALLAVALLGYTQQPFILNTVLLVVGCGLLGGLITAAVTALFLPICESSFGILTDVKLLELSNADLPVLGQLALRAPGTNQHSHAVGQLCEDACRAVGANGLLARIGALYHDIGKTAAPEHFVENQMNGKNPHDKLKPAQSAKIIISHVTYGIKLGKEIGLPQRIIDFIPQHHGTRTLHYFLRKAHLDLREGEELEENDFRYPGPKPQFKEAAIMMIADSCEAGARALQEPNAENIRFIVTKIIDAILSDDQLDECDLTLRELTLIREAMIRSLTAIYHSRVEYPGYVPPTSLQKIIIPTELADSEEQGLKFANPADIPISKGGEIEDEAIDRSNPPQEMAQSKTVN